jgi:hypothetical protein
MEDRIRYVGVDVHKEGIVVAVAKGIRGEIREYGRIAIAPTREARPKAVVRFNSTSHIVQPRRSGVRCLQATPTRVRRRRDLKRRALG